MGHDPRIHQVGHEDSYGGLVLHLSGPAGRVEWWRHGGVRVHATSKPLGRGWHWALHCPVYGSGCWTNVAFWRSWSAWCDQIYQDNLRVDEGAARTEVYAILAGIYQNLWLEQRGER